MARRPTMKDVAREAGLSVATVDRALNGRSTVREETLRKIARAADVDGAAGPSPWTCMSAAVSGCAGSTLAHAARRAIRHDSLRRATTI